MIKNIAYGKNDKGRYYVQTCCGEKHKGQACDCKELSTHSTMRLAKLRATKVAKILKVPAIKW